VSTLGAEPVTPARPEAGATQVVAVTSPLRLGSRRQVMLGPEAEGKLEPVVHLKLSEQTYQWGTR
jgi:hypothetical protein